jgi:D-alanyl-D-alanine carboxypeptidase (penicillin-binding protein 5/6)
MRLARLICLAATAASLAAAPAHAQYTTSAKHAVLLDYDTGEILFNKDGDVPMPPSSMSKLMTIELVFQRLKEHTLKLTDTFHVSSNAWRTARDKDQSRMFVEAGSDISVDDLLKGIIVDSGNDACVVVAEALGGSEEGFAQMMTRRAQELGLTQSHFANPTGMPDPGQYMSARDLASLAAHILRTYPKYYSYFGMPGFTWNGINQENHNPLLAMNIGADGIKTGYTDAGGYGLVASAVRDGRRVILVVNGFDSKQERAEEARRVLEIAYRDFKRYDLFHADDLVAQAEVWGGALSILPLKVREPLSITLPVETRPDLKITLQYKKPIPAPVKAGQKVGALTVLAPNRPPKTIPVFAAADVAPTGIIGRILIGAEAYLAEQKARLH